jgi:hypothetical protein
MHLISRVPEHIRTAKPHSCGECKSMRSTDTVRDPTVTAYYYATTEPENQYSDHSFQIDKKGNEIQK